MTASETEMDFIRAILAAPEDDAPRLIFADWLEEHDKDGSPIRTQCGQRWSSGERLYSSIGLPAEGSDLGWQRGFIERIECTAEWWLTNAAEMTKYHPIRRVTLTTDVNVVLNRPYNQRHLPTSAYFEYGDWRPVLYREGADTIDELLKTNWPHIEFTFTNP